MRRLMTGAVIVASLSISTAHARSQDKPITDRNPDAVDVAKTPMNDLNVGRDDEIPPLLIQAQAKPYALEGVSTCRQIAMEVEKLNEILGDDIDLPQDPSGRFSGGRVAKMVVSSFIPFRGVIREISGANERDRQLNAAIQAGLTRRGFLKGVGATKGCRYPATPAPASVVKARQDEIDAQSKKDEAKKAADEKNGKDTAPTDVAAKR